MNLATLREHFGRAEVLGSIRIVMAVGYVYETVQGHLVDQEF